MLKSIKKRKYEKENRSFRLEWEDDWAFTMQGDKPLFLIRPNGVKFWKTV